MTREALIALWVVAGLAGGAGLDSVIRLLLKRRSDLLRPLCPACEAAACDTRLIPIYGAFAHWRCAVCARMTGRRLLAMELGCSAVLAALASRSFLQSILLVYSCYALVLVLIFVMDLEHRLIFNVVSYSASVASLALGGVLYGPPFSAGLLSSLVGGLVCGGLFLAIFALAVLVYRRVDAFGLGDVKLALLIGVMLGWPQALAGILLGTLIGGVLAVVVLLVRRSGKVTMPYGTALTAGAVISILLRPPVA